MTKDTYHGKICKRRKLGVKYLTRRLHKKRKQTTDKKEILIQNTNCRRYHGHVSFEQRSFENKRSMVRFVINDFE